jgi:dTDP-4-dehydrorhamnose reductase
MSDSSKQIYLIVGGESIIGQCLCDHLKQMGRKVIYTTRRRRSQKENSIYLDLEDNIDHWVPPRGIKTAFFCAAATSMEFCEKNINATRKINVVNTIKIIETLSQKKIPVVFLSSNQVFDGVSPYPGETSFTMPETEYGCQKLEVEERLKNIELNHSIVRATKIIYPNYPLFNNWISSLNQGIPIYPFNDLFFSPVLIDFFVTVLVKVAGVKEGGTWHVSGNKDLSYYEAAVLIAKISGADPNLVQHSKARDKLKDFYCTQSTVLKCSRVESRFGIKPPEVGETIKNAVGQ